YLYFRSFPHDALPIWQVESSFGIVLDEDVTMLDLAGAYGVFAAQGVYFGRDVNDDFTPITVLRVESADRAVLLDWSLPQARTVRSEEHTSELQSRENL